MHVGHRQLLRLEGARKQTAARATAALLHFDPARVLWVGGEAPEGWPACTPSELARHLGESWQAVVLDQHDGVQPDGLARAQGLVVGGGALVCRAHTRDEEAPAPARLIAPPYAGGDVGRRLAAHARRVLRAASVPERPLPLPRFTAEGNAEQAAVVQQLVAALSNAPGAVATLLADRGRGKSSALGLALAQLLADGQARIVVTAATEDAAREIFRFGVGGTATPREGRVRFVPASSLLDAPVDYDVLLVDEAAQLPVPLLQRLTRHAAMARIAFATTTGGYEGTGRGFTLRFLDWLAREPREHLPLTLLEPVRWAAGDPLERAVFDALLLDAQPDEPPSELREVRAVALDRDALVQDLPQLRAFFGLLVQAHYRTTPADLERMLDAPNVRLHALRAEPGGALVGATWLALEGGLSAEQCDAVHRGAGRLTGHALPETLISHLGHPEAGALNMVRSVRIAVHPSVRQRGLARQLVEHVHASYAPDLFGTLFGSTPGLLRFRRRVGYELIRVGASRGSRTGEPAAVMLHAVSPRAEQLLRTLRAELARDLPVQLELHRVDHALLLDAEHEGELLCDLPGPAPLDAEWLAACAGSYAHGPRIFEAVAEPLRRYVQAHADAVQALPAMERLLLEKRVVERASWVDVAAAASLPSVPAAMRALRRAFRRLYDSVETAGG